jgi:hypothetical protein
MKLNQFTYYFILILGLTMTMALSTGCAVDGCTNPNAENYDPDATNDDGSCVLAREKFLGQYNVNESCPSGTYSFQINIVASSSGEDAIVINNLGDFGESVTATVNQSSISIPNQNISEGGFTVSINGSGSISGNILTISYTYDFSGNGETCTMNCTKL